MEHEDFPPRTSCLGHARTTGYRRHSERLRWHVMWVFLLFVTFPGCGGCGGGNASPTMDPTKPWAGLGSKEAYEKWRAEQEAADAEKEKKLAVSQPKEPPRQVTNHQPAAAPNPAAPNEAVVEIENDPKTPTLPPLPATPRNVAHWSERDFIVARLRQQPTLSSAIERLGAQGKDDETAVRILTKLLQPGLFAELLDLAVGEPPKSEPAYSDEVIRSAVDALGRNGTPAARNVLGQLIIGRLATENNLLAASQALATLAAHPSPDHEEMLVRVATDAEVLAASGTSGLSAEALRQQALTLISQNATPTLRTQIAKTLASKYLSTELRAAFEKLVSAAVRENFDAQLALYLAPRDIISFRDSIERQFAMYSGDALVSALTPFGDPVDRQWNTRVAETLWAEKFGLMVVARLNRLDRWAEEPALLSLACSLPTHSMRAAVTRKLQKQWALGPEPFASQQIGETVVEPGILVLLRSIYEQRADSEPTRKTPLVSLRYGRRVSAEGVRLQEYHDVQESWATVAGNLAAIWCGRCRNAALDRDAKQRASGRRTDWASQVKQFPVAPHSNEGLVAAHWAAWNGLPGREPSSESPDTLRMHYIRLEERARPKRLVATYRRAWPDLRPREIPEGGCLEGVIEGSAPGFLRSVDIRITRAAYGARQLPDEEQELVLEILVVEVRDPGIGYSASTSMQ